MKLLSKIVIEELTVDTDLATCIVVYIGEYEVTNDAS